MVATILVVAGCIYAVGLRADRIHAGRTVTEREVSSVGEHPASRSVTVTYRGLTASQWAARFRHRTRQLQAARRNEKHAQAALRQAPWGNSTLERAFLCIHTFEGSWTDAGAPFWGGLQMDSSFQSSYGDWAVRAFGTADHWPVSVQIATAIRAYVSGRGFYPWPNTARSCGLL